MESEFSRKGTEPSRPKADLVGARGPHVDAVVVGEEGAAPQCPAPTARLALAREPPTMQKLIGKQNKMYPIYQNMLHKFSVSISPSINYTYCHYNKISSQYNKITCINNGQQME
jgi:hypothetical protein